MINYGTNTLIVPITIYAPTDLGLIDMEMNKKESVAYDYFHNRSNFPNYH